MWCGDRDTNRSSGTRLAGLLIAIVAAAGVGCTPPVGVRRISVAEEHSGFNRNALTSPQPSDVSQIVLRRYNLVTLFEQQPQLALSRLRDLVVSGRGGNDEIFALAELSYLYSVQAQSRPDALAAAVYAYAYLFPDDPADRPSAIDPRYRWACDIYAEGLTQTLRGPGGATLHLQSGAYPLPFGTLTVEFDPAELVWGSRRLKDFVPVSEYAIRGLNNRYRQPGIGVALAAQTEKIGEGTPADALIEDKVRVPATVLLRLEHPRQQIAGAELHGLLDLFAATDREEVEIDSATVPLEIDRTATVAVTLAEGQFWNQELASFLGNATGVRKQARLVVREPYRPGRIPVVFVHGTNSSNGRWADMVNDLENDPRIRRRFQFWFFTYDSGNPIAYSAMLLRRALRDAVASFDPEGRDACLHEMVVMGHSQGGLLTKMTVINSGPAFWNNVSEMPFDEVRLSDKSRALLQEAMFVEPLPFVTRVVFIATPHRGSYLAGSGLVRRLVAKLVSMPREITAVGTDVFAVRDPTKRIVSLERFPTSIDNMSPGNPFIETLSSIPVAPGVAAHSIIPVEGEGPLADGVDGVVAYSSAHIEGVESERVVRPSSHSTQSNPETIDEVRRILLLQAEEHPCAVAAPADTSSMQPSRSTHEPQ
jgi:pimeloyl-ACP methyl ester carboxylesterase